MIQITPEICIDEDDLEESFVRSSGPGGQNVNKVATAVQLRFDVSKSALPERVRARLRLLAGNQITSDGILIVEAQTYRSQSKNREEARRRLVELIQEAARNPRKRVPTRPTLASQSRRLDSKKRRGELKSRRGRVVEGEWQ